MTSTPLYAKTCVVGFLALFSTSPVHAADFMWCVDSSGGVPFVDCAGSLTCTPDSGGQDVFSSVADALTAARDIGGEDDVHHLCVWSEPTHVEDIVIDNADGGLGAEVHLWFASDDQDYCPASSGSAITVIGAAGQDPPTPVSINSMQSDFRQCGSNNGVLIDATDVALRFEDLRLAGFGGTFVEQSSVTSDSRTIFFASRADQFDGALVVGSTGLNIDNSEFAGFAAPAGTALIDLSQSFDNANLTYSALFGHVTDNAPLIRFGSQGRVLHFTLAGNRIVDHDTLMEWAPDSGGELIMGSLGISRNAFVTGGPVEPAPEWSSNTQDDSSTQFCLPAPSEGSWLVDRTAASGGTDASAAAILEVSAGLGESEPGGLLFERSMVVETEATSVDALVRLEGDLGQLDLTVLQNTVTGPIGAVVLDQADSGTASLALARNLYAGEMAPTLGPNWRAITASMETGAIDPAGWTSALSGVATASEIVGPFFASSPEFQPEGDVRAMTACERLEASCSNFYGDCDGNGPGDGFMTQGCWLDRSVAYVPTAAWRDANTQRWPWTGGYFLQLPDGNAYNAPGATGWDCHFVLLPNDEDGDGHSPLTDCHDDDANDGPSLPEPNGYDSDECVDDPDDCFDCPEGSTLIDPPGDDDDSTTSDDDDAADDDDASGDDDDTSTNDVYVGCLGCGTAILPPGAMALLPLMLLRRRRF